jgi:hypothetical protein
VAPLVRRGPIWCGSYRLVSDVVSRCHHRCLKICQLLSMTNNHLDELHEPPPFPLTPSVLLRPSLEVEDLAAHDEGGEFSMGVHGGFGDGGEWGRQNGGGPSPGSLQYMYLSQATQAAYWENHGPVNTCTRRSEAGGTTCLTAPIHTDTQNLCRPDLGARRRSWSAVGGQDSPRSRPSVERVATGAANRAEGKGNRIKKSRKPSGVGPDDLPSRVQARLL